ncbi:RDD family protein [Planococcus lenghuensis]
MLVYQLVIPILWIGFTVGKRLMGIRIRRMDGKAVSFGTTFLRYVVAELVYLSPIILFSLLGFLGPSIFSALIGLGGVLTSCLYIASAIMVGTREDARAIHDFIAGTQVVRTEK